MREIWVSLGVVGLVAACSSSSSGTEPACQIVGTYSVLEAKQDGTCPDPGSTPDTFTVSQNGDGYLLQTSGTTGGCPAEVVGQCKIQGKCDLSVKDPVDPTKGTGTLQFSWTFDAAGLKGSMTLALPASAASPTACAGDYATTGTRK